MHFRSLLSGLFLTALAIASSGCAANVASTELHPMIAGVRIDPPRPGENNVYLDFRDLTGDDLEDEVFDAISDALEDRGWELANDFYSANYVLWADLRLFSEAGTEAGNQALAALGGVAAGAAIGHATYKATGNWWAGAGAGAVGGGMTSIAIGMINKTTSYQMVVDLMLGRKIEGGIVTGQDSGMENEAASISMSATSAGGEAGKSAIGSSKTQELEEVRVHFDLEQRLLATAKGRRMTKDMAKEALIPKLVSGIKSQMPRVRR